MVLRPGERGGCMLDVSERSVWGGGFGGQDTVTLFPVDASGLCVFVVSNIG